MAGPRDYGSRGTLKGCGHICIFRCLETGPYSNRRPLRRFPSTAIERRPFSRQRTPRSRATIGLAAVTSVDSRSPSGGFLAHILFHATWQSDLPLDLVMCAGNNRDRIGSDAARASTREPLPRHLPFPRSATAARLQSGSESQADETLRACKSQPEAERI